MIRDIMSMIKEVTIEAVDLAKRMQEITNEGFIVLTPITQRLNRSSIEIHPAKRPFPLAKFPLIQRELGGRWEKARTKCNFTKLTQLRHSSAVRLSMNVYMRECLNPQSWQKVQVLKGTRGKVLTPDLCDGAEFAIMRGLNIGDRSASDKLGGEATP
jgi:hypothetical protein